jgi:hypothetical protein
MKPLWTGLRDADPSRRRPCRQSRLKPPIQMPMTEAEQRTTKLLELLTGV